MSEETINVSWSVHQQLKNFLDNKVYRAQLKWGKDWEKHVPDDFCGEFNFDVVIQRILYELDLAEKRIYELEDVLEYESRPKETPAAQDKEESLDEIDEDFGENSM